MNANNFQRVGAVSNTHAGSEFEALAKEYFSKNGIELAHDHKVPVGVGKLKKQRKFDLGSEEPRILVECKSHNWTESGNVPSAKITVWNESMYYFYIAPNNYRKVFFVLKSVRNGESLSNYYIRNYGHLIPDTVEIFEYDAAIGNATCVRPSTG